MRRGFCFLFNGSHSAPFVEKILHSLLNYSGTSVEICWPYMCRSFSGLDSFPLIYVSLLKPTFHHLNDCKKACFPLYCESLSWFSFEVLFVKEETCGSKRLTKQFNVEPIITPRHALSFKAKSNTKLSEIRERNQLPCGLIFSCKKVCYSSWFLKCHSETLRFSHWERILFLTTVYYQ